MDIIISELGIPKRHLKSTNRAKKVIAIVHQSWLKSLINHHRLIDFKENECFQSWPYNDQEFDKSWCRIFICVYNKCNAKAIPLPRVHSNIQKTDTNLIFNQLLHYVMQTNHKNLWKEAYKKYSSNHNETQYRDNHIAPVDYNTVLREVIFRAYGCNIIKVGFGYENNILNSSPYETHRNLLQALCAIETNNAFFTIHSPYIPFTLQDCITFSPAVLESLYSKPLFLIFQLLHALRAMHDKGLIIGDITLSDIYLNENLWLNIIPQLESNVIVCDENENIHSRLKRENFVRLRSECGKNVHVYENSRCVHCGIKCYDKVNVDESTDLEKLCQLWIYGQISNFTYLTALNNLAGRKIGDPNCHHVFPWVTDFYSRCGNNWRDLTKSKYRLNKGDRQLDLTYDTKTLSQTAHHVSDVLSSITYYVYMARRTSKSILCKNVRTVWVPAEYPSSIQRLQEWTPDECIPEFFSSPLVFKSIHEDLPDLEIPPWSSSPEDFVEKHREALESSYVSEKLHHWIDLTFGYKLSGQPAVKAKNVCLQLVDNHQTLSHSGVVQVFHYPHPSRQSAIPHPWAGSLPPKINFIKAKRKKHHEMSTTVSTESQQRLSEDEDISSGFDEDTLSSNSQPKPNLTLSRLISRSRTSLNEDCKNETSNTSPTSAMKLQKNPTFISHVQPSATQIESSQKSTFQSYVPINNSTKTNHTLNSSGPHQLSVQKSTLNSGTIYLPKEYNPSFDIATLESYNHFYAKTFHHCMKKEESTDSDCKDMSFINNFSSTDDDRNLNNEFTNQLFIESYEQKLKLSQKNTFVIKDKDVNHSFKQAVASRRLRELQVLGCLIVEIFMARHLRALGLTVQLDFNTRLKSCLTVYKSCNDSVPSCVKYMIELLLQVSSDNVEYIKYPTVTDKGLPPPSAHQLLQPLLSSLISPFPYSFWNIYSFLSDLQNFTLLSQELEIRTFFECCGNNCSKYENLEYNKISIARNINECKVKICANQLDKLSDELNSPEIVELVLPFIKNLIEDPASSVLAAWHLFDPISKVLGPIKTTEALLKPILKLYEDNGDIDLENQNKIIKIYHHSFLLCLIVRFGLSTFLDNFITPLVEAVGGYKDIESLDFYLHSHNTGLNTLKKTSNLKYVQENEQKQADPLSPFDEDSVTDSDKNISPEKDNADCQIDSTEKQNEPEIFMFDNEDKMYSSSNQNYETLNTRFLIDDLEEADSIKTVIENNSVENTPLSPTIPIPSTLNRCELNTIKCDVGSKKSTEEVICQSEGSESVFLASDTYFSSDNKTSRSESAQNTSKNTKQGNNNAKISDISSDSIIWLSHRLGPVLTARYLSRNLLRMLTLCYLGQENLVKISKDKFIDENSLDSLSIVSSQMSGDLHAIKVLECLTSIAALYGEQFILLQYLPHISELVTLCKRKITPNLEGGLISCVALLKHIIPYLADVTLMDNLQDVIIKLILIPCIRLAGTTKHTFPNGSTARNALVMKFVDTLYLLSKRVGADITRSYIVVPTLQRFFLIFDKLLCQNDENYKMQQEYANDMTASPVLSVEESNYLEIRRDGSTAEWIMKNGRPSRVGPIDLSGDSWSPPTNLNDKSLKDLNGNKALEELQDVFTSELAHKVYSSFSSYLGESYMESVLKNHNHIQDLCCNYEQKIRLKNTENQQLVFQQSEYSQINDTEPVIGSSGSFSSNVSIVGNRIELTTNDTKSTDIFGLVNSKMENTSRHLKGNWLAYWEHEIGRADKDTKFNFKQIKLQSYNGHINSIKVIHALDNENSFLTGSRDKTVKLWSLRSQGDGTLISSPQWTYVGHKKSILAISFIESMRLVASCDSTVHIWDPFMGNVISQLEGLRNTPVNVLKVMPAPSSTILAATTEGNIKLIDARICTFTNELKTSVSPGGLIRRISISPCGRWVAAGHSTGTMSVLDLRYGGKLLSMWKAHENEVLQLAVLDSDTLITSSIDGVVSAWNPNNGKLLFNLKKTSEPAHCLSSYNKGLIIGTTANRIGVYSMVDTEESVSSTRLRSETFKGNLTAMTVLPLNKLLLLGSDNGGISLLC